MSIKSKYNIIIFLLFISLIQTQNITNITKKKYNEQSLYDFIKPKFLSPDKPEDMQKLHYMLVDPEEYLKSISTVEIRRNLELLYKEFNITSFIYIVNAIEKNRDLNYKLRDFSSEIFSDIYKYNIDFNERLTISALFQIEEKKMHIRLGSTCREIIGDLLAVRILRKREKDLKKKNLEKLFNEFTSDLLTTYRKNYKMYKNVDTSKLAKKAIISFVIMVFILVLLIVCYCMRNKYNIDMDDSQKAIIIDKYIKTIKEKKIKDFINKHKNEKFEKVIDDICIICLEKFENEKNIKSTVFTGNSDEEDNMSNEKITIPCKHSFHTKCILNWFKQEKRCPICRTKFEFYDKEEKNENSDNLLNIKNYNINNTWEYDNNSIFIEYINNFVRIQKIMNPYDINTEFCSKIINEYENNYDIIKIKN